MHDTIVFNVYLINVLKLLSDYQRLPEVGGLIAFFFSKSQETPALVQ